MDVKLLKLQTSLPKSRRHHFTLPQQCVSIPVPPHLHQHLVQSVLLISIIPMAKQWCVSVVLTCISLTNNVEHLPMCFHTFVRHIPVFCWFLNRGYFITEFTTLVSMLMNGIGLSFWSVFGIKVIIVLVGG